MDKEISAEHNSHDSGNDSSRFFFSLVLLMAHKIHMKSGSLSVTVACS